MSTETQSLDADAFVDEGNVEAGLPVDVEVNEAPPVEGEAPAPEAQQQEEAPAKEQPAESPPAKEEASDDRSFLVPETEQQQETETTVPVHVVAKLRAKNRDLKQQLEQAQTRPAGENADVGADPLEGLDDDDLLTAGQARATRVHDQAVAEQRTQEVSQQAAQKEKLTNFLLQSEKQAKADHPDYTAVMTAAEDYMSPGEFQSALQTKNPAKVLYAKAKQTIAALGIEVQTPVAPKQKKGSSQEEEVIQTDDEVFDDVFPST